MVVVRGLRPGWSKAGTSWSHELVGYGLDLFHRRNLRTPTVRELKDGVPGLPSHATIRKRYGNASKMLEAHGYAVRARGGQPGHPCWWTARDERGRIVSRSAVLDSQASTATAQRRPSLIAQTISD
jgi:hypothetical protein